MGASTPAPGGGQAPSSAVARLAALAGRLGLDGDVLAGFVADGGRLSFAPVPTGVGSGRIASAVAALGNARMPMTEDSFPDFDAVLAAGGTVTVVLAPDGSTTFPRSPATWGRWSPTPRSSPSATARRLPRQGQGRERRSDRCGGDRADLLGQLVWLVDRAPDDLEQARLWAHLNDWPTQRQDDTRAPVPARLEAWT